MAILAGVGIEESGTRMPLPDEVSVVARVVSPDTCDMAGRSTPAPPLGAVWEALANISAKALRAWVSESRHTERVCHNLAISQTYEPGPG